jgi:hypothetical protein
MGVFANRQESEQRDRDGKTKTHIVESRTVVSGRSASDSVDAEVVDQRSIRSADFSAATVNGFLGIVLLALEAVLATRFLLIAFGANRTSGFVSFMLDLSWPFVRPFSNAFAIHSWDQGIIEPASLLAIGVYAIAFGLVMLIISAVVPTYRERHDVARSQTTHV